MALKIEELQLLISANADQFKGELMSVKDELRKLNKTTQQATDGFGGQLFGNIMKANIATTAFLGTISQVTSRMGGMIKQVISGGSQLARLRIATAAVTTNLGLTTKQIDGLRASLAEANTYGIAAEEVISKLALSGMIDLAESLSYVDARSGETAEGVTALVLAIKDLSAARGMDSDLGIRNIARFIQTGQTEVVEGLIEIGDMTQKYKAAALAMGRANSDSLTEIERAKVRMDVVMQESAKSFGAYAATYNTSGKIFSSVQMLVRGIATEIGANLEPVMRVGALGILEFFRGIQEAVFGSADAIRNTANKIAGYMVALIRIIGRLGSSLPFIGAGFRRLADFTLKPIQALGTMQKATGGAGKGLDNTAKKMGNTGKAAKKLASDLAGLAGFDEMNVLKDPTEDAAGGGSGLDPDMGAIGGGVGIGDVGGGLAGVQDTTEEIMKYAKEAEENIKRIFDPIINFLKPFAGVLGEVAKWVGIFWLAFKVGLPILSIILSPLVTIWGWISKLIGVFGIAKGIIVSFAAAMGIPLAPIIAIVAAIAAVVAIFALLYTQNEQFRASIDALVQGAFAWIQQNLVPIFEQIVAKVQEMVAIFVERLPEIQAALQPLIDAIAVFFVQALQLAGKIIDWLWKNILKPLVDFILANIVPAFNLAIDILIVVITVFSQIASTVLSIVMPVLNALWDVFTTVFEAIRSIVDFVWNKVLKPIFTAVWDVITKLIIPVIQNLLVIFGHVFNAIKTIAENVWNGIKKAIEPVINWIRDNIMPHINKVKEGMENAFNKVKDTVSSVWEGIKAGFKNGINGVIDFVNGFIRKINGLIEKVNSVATKIPGVQAIEFRVGEIPKLATGGIVRKPTLAQIGEGGYSEAVLPLDRNTEWAAQVADLINKNGGGDGNGKYIIVQLGDEVIFEKFIDYANDRAVTTNKPFLNI